MGFCELTGTCPKCGRPEPVVAEAYYGYLVLEMDFDKHIWAEREQTL